MTSCRQDPETARTPRGYDPNDPNWQDYEAPYGAPENCCVRNLKHAACDYPACTEA